MDTAAITLAGAVVAALATVLVARWRFSGKIESSEASELWAESRSIRDWSQARIEGLEKELARVRQEYATCMEGRAQDRERIAKLELQITQLGGDDAPDWLS